MPDHHIDMRAHEVRALLREAEAPGTGKTQTRLVLKPQPKVLKNGIWYRPYPGTDPRLWAYLHGDRVAAYATLRFARGDRLWVREAFNAFQFSQDGDDAWPVKVPTLAECREADDLAYRYGAPEIVYRESDRARKWFSDQPWRSPIFMPRWASRLTLTVTEVRVQRLWEITEGDAVAEGLHPVTRKFPEMQMCKGALRHRQIYEWPGGWSVDAVPAYRALWNSLHGPGAWEANPWVPALTFTVEQRNIDGGP